MKKRLLSLILILCMVLGMAAVTASAAETHAITAKLTDGTQLPVEQMEDVDAAGMGMMIPWYQITVPVGMEEQTPLELTYDGELVAEFYPMAVGGMMEVAYYTEVCYLMDMDNFMPYVAITFVEGEIATDPTPSEPAPSDPTPSEPEEDGNDLVIPDGAPFTAITTDKGEAISVTEADELTVTVWGTEYTGTLYHVVIPEGADAAQVTLNLSQSELMCYTNPVSVAGYYGNAVDGYDNDEFIEVGQLAGGASFAFTADGDSTIITIPMQMRGKSLVKPADFDPDSSAPYYAAGPEYAADFAPVCFFTFEYAAEGGEEPECQHEETETTYTTVDGEKHTVTETCSCGEVINEQTVACVDADKNLKCDACGGAVACKHAGTETTTDFQQVAGEEKHTVTIFCSCGSEISKTTVACADANTDGQCDVCKGAVEVPVVTEPTVIFDSSVQGAWNTSITISKLLVDGVTVKSYEWSGDTCIVTLAADTPKDAAITFSYEGLSGGGGAGAVYINGDKNLRTVNLVDGAAEVKVRTASKFSSTSQWKEKTISFQLEGTTFVPVESIIITPMAPSVQAGGGKLQLVANIIPENATVKDVIWETTAGSTAITLNETGLVMGQTMGMGQYYTITATSVSNPDVKASTRVLLDYKMETAISISQETMALQVGETGSLSASVTADQFSGNRTVTWSSSDESVATVANGKVTGLKNGTATITATSYHGLTATCEVTVEGGSPECDHEGTQTNTLYEQVAGNETHTVSVMCQCGGQIGEATTENCVDENNDQKCDKCAGTVAAAVTKLTWWIGDSVVTEITVDAGDVVDAVTGCTPRSTEGSKVTYTSTAPEIVRVNTAEAVADNYGHAYTSFTALKAGETTVTATAESGVQGVLKVKVVSNSPEQIGGVYQLATAEDLLWFAETVNGGNTAISAVLTANINLTGKEWSGIGTYNYPFAGSFDGQNKTVTFDNATNGLFAYVIGTAEQRAEIKNVITAGSINAEEAGTAAIAGRAQLANISNCTNYASVKSSWNYTAGIVGHVAYNYAAVTVRNCVNAGEIWSNRARSGGIVGNAEPGKNSADTVIIENCCNTAVVTAQNWAGGIAGYIANSHADTAQIRNCYNTGTVVTIPNEANGQPYPGNAYGGITGVIYRAVTVENCYNTGTAGYGLFGNVGTTEGMSVVNSYYLDTAASSAYPKAPETVENSGTKTAAEMGSAEFAALLGQAYQTSCPAPVFTWQNVVEHNFTDGACANCGAKAASAAPEKGDLDEDGVLTAKDATEILKMVASGAEFVTLADMDNDGKITAKDATEILKVVAAGTPDAIE